MANPFSKIFDLSNFGLFKKSASVLAVDIGTSSAKVIQLRKDRGRIILETYGELSTGPYAGLAVGQAAPLSVEKTGEVLRDLFKEANVTTTAGSMAIPLRSSLLVSIEIPDMSRAELERAIPLEARKYVPVPISEVALDWWIIPRQAGDTIVTTEGPARPSAKTIEVLIVAIHKDTLKQYDAISKAVNMSPKFYEIETFSTIRSSMHNDLAATVIVDMGASTTKVAIVDFGIVRLSHTINKGAQDITVAISRSLGVSFAKAEEIKRKVGLIERLGEQTLSPTISPVVEYVFSELNKVMVNYQKKHNRSIDKVILVGGGSLLKGLQDIARKSVEVPVAIGTPFDKVEAPAFLEPVLTEAGPGFAVSIGLALRALQEL